MLEYPYLCTGVITYSQAAYGIIGDTPVRREELSFVDWLVEAYYLRMVLRLSRVPHFTTLQKFTGRISGSMLER
ncbi:MAG: hypothetical protein WBZ36_15875 [Candidatus Nitrosopolaris sp.]